MAIDIEAIRRKLNNLQTQLDALLNKIEGYIDQGKKLTKEIFLLIIVSGILIV